MENERLKSELGQLQNQMADLRYKLRQMEFTDLLKEQKSSSSAVPSNYHLEQSRSSAVTSGYNENRRNSPCGNPYVNGGSASKSHLFATNDQQNGHESIADDLVGGDCNFGVGSPPPLKMNGHSHPLKYDSLKNGGSGVTDKEKPEEPNNVKFEETNKVKTEATKEVKSEEIDKVKSEEKVIMSSCSIETDEENDGDVNNSTDSTATGTTVDAFSPNQTLITQPTTNEKQEAPLQSMMGNVVDRKPAMSTAQDSGVGSLPATNMNTLMSEVLTDSSVESLPDPPKSAKSITSPAMVEYDIEQLHSSLNTSTFLTAPLEQDVAGDESTSMAGNLMVAAEGVVSESGSRDSSSEMTADILLDAALNELDHEEPPQEGERDTADGGYGTMEKTNSIDTTPLEPDAYAENEEVYEDVNEESKASNSQSDPALTRDQTFKIFKHLKKSKERSKKCLAPPTKKSEKAEKLPLECRERRNSFEQLNEREEDHGETVNIDHVKQDILSKSGSNS